MDEEISAHVKVSSIRPLNNSIKTKAYGCHYTHSRAPDVGSIIIAKMSIDITFKSIEIIL